MHLTAPHQPTRPRRPAGRRRGLRDLVLLAVLAALGIALLTSAPAGAHEGHASLPAGFRAEITRIVDGTGAPAELAGVSFAVAEDGIGATVTNTGDRLLEVVGEQAAEPLLRVTASDAHVNEASPQAADVEGAVVDPGAVGTLQDLAWGRVPAVWIALPEGGTVSWIDHRAAPGHPPVRAEYDAGDVAGQWRIGFTYDGEPYRVEGRIVALPTAGDGGAGWLLAGGAAGLLALAVCVVLLRRGREDDGAGKVAETEGVAEREPVAVP